jgi:hypothetical protein
MEDKKNLSQFNTCFKLSKHNKCGQFSRNMKFYIVIAGLVAVAMSEINV